MKGLNFWPLLGLKGAKPRTSQILLLTEFNQQPLNEAQKKSAVLWNVSILF